jgi:hypothetical protein
MCDIINDMSLFKTFNIQYILVISNNCNNNIIIKIIYVMQKTHCKYSSAIHDGR